MKRAIVITVTMLCAACMTPQKTEFLQAMDKWKGRSADDLVVAFGLPFNISEEESGVKMLEYFKNKYGKAVRKQRILPGNEASINNQIDVEIQGATDNLWLLNHMKQYGNEQRLAASSDIQLSCKIRFKVSADNIVVGWTTEGKGCN